MDLGKILTISGKNGLFSVVTQSKTNIIVESLIDGKKIPVFPTDRSSTLHDIRVFTYGEDMPLKNILLKMYEKEDGKPSLDPRSEPEQLRAYFETIVPDFDKERVYNSDIKKIFSWYNLLVEKGLISKEELEEAPAEEAQADKLSEELADKPVKAVKAAPKNKPDLKPAKFDAGQRKTRQKK